MSLSFRLSLREDEIFVSSNRTDPRTTNKFHSGETFTRQRISTGKCTSLADDTIGSGLCRHRKTFTTIDCIRSIRTVKGGQSFLVEAKYLVDVVLTRPVSCVDDLCRFFSLLQLSFSFGPNAVVYDDKLYIFGGYNNLLGRHFNDFYQFDPMTLIWRQVRVHGLAGPIPRRRQCCLVIGHQMFLYGGTSPIASLASTNGNNITLHENFDPNQVRLYDQSDLHILDFCKS